MVVESTKLYFELQRKKIVMLLQLAVVTLLLYNSAHHFFSFLWMYRFSLVRHSTQQMRNRRSSLKLDLELHPFPGLVRHNSASW